MKRMGKIKKTLKFFIVIFTISCFYLCHMQISQATQCSEEIDYNNFTTIASAADEVIKAKTDRGSIYDIINSGKKWIDQGEKAVSEMGNKDELSAEGFANMFIGLGQILVAIGAVTLVITTLITAIKWITATPDKQAKLKQQLIGLVVSAIVIFGAVGIWNLIRGIMENVEDSLALNNNNDIIIMATKDEYTTY